VSVVSAVSAVSDASAVSAVGTASAAGTRPALTRREFLQVSVSAAGGLAVSLVMPALAAAEGATRPKLPPAVNQPLGSFVRIEPDGRIVIGARGCELGQGVRTSLPMLIAEELDVPWLAVTVEQLPYGLVASADPPGVASRYGPQGAGGSTSIPDAWHELRQVGARARWLLVQAAAQEWRESAKALRTEDAHVVHPDGRRLSYAQLALRAAALTPPEGEVPMKESSAYRIIGHPTRVADGRDIVTGAAAYGIDAALPGALTVLIARCPYFDGSLGELDEAQARRIAGVRQVVTIPPPRAGAPLDRNLAAGVAVVADDFWSAHRGREALRIRWTAGPGVKDSSAALEQRAAAAFGKGGLIARQDGDFAAARRSAARVIERTYVEPFLAHATMEPPNALIDLKADRALLMASLQSPGGASRMINAMTGIPRPDIEIRLPRTGGGFGRRLENDFVAEAVLVAQKVGAPVKVLWTREDDLQNDFYRPFGVHRLGAALDATGRVTGCRSNSSSPAAGGARRCRPLPRSLSRASSMSLPTRRGRIRWRCASRCSGLRASSTIAITGDRSFIPGGWRRCCGGPRARSAMDGNCHPGTAWDSRATLRTVATRHMRSRSPCLGRVSSTSCAVCARRMSARSSTRSASRRSSWAAPSTGCPRRSVSRSPSRKGGSSRLTSPTIRCCAWRTLPTSKCT